jgi:pimeloyl-ACP methyl ester carboxylesterase
VPREEWRSGVTRDGISIALAKLEREGEEVRVWIAFRKVSNPPPGEEIAGFDVNIRDDRGNTYPQDRMGTYAVPLWSGVDIRLLPMGFTWVTSATIGMPAQAPIQSIIVNVNKNAPGYSNWPFPVLLDPQSAKWPTIDLDVVRENDLTGKKFKLSRDITLWLGQPILEESEKVVEEKTQKIRWRIPVFVHNEDYNPRRVPLEYFRYFLYFGSGEIMPLRINPWVSDRAEDLMISGNQWEIPPARTVEGKHITDFMDPPTGEPVAIVVEMSGGSNFKMLGFLPLQPGRGAEASGVASGNREAGTAWTVHNAKMNYRSVIYAKGLFVVGGSEGTILTSPDGEEWTKENSATFRDIVGIAYGNNLFVAIGSWGTIITSPDGRQWAEERLGDLPLPSEILQSLLLLTPTDVTFGNGRFVVVSGEGRIRTSLDARKWKDPDDMPLGMTFRGLYGVTYSNGLFVAVGINGTILTSPDGEKWDEQSSGTKNSLTDVCFGNGLFVAVGSEGTILTSPDGKTWTRQDSGIRNNLSGITYGNGLFVAVGSEGTILISPDGRSWTKQNSGTTKHLHDVAYGNGLFVAVGDGVILTLGSEKISDKSSSESPTAPSYEEERKVIFIQGLNSESGSCGQSFRSRVQWMMDYLVNTPWVREGAPSLDSPQDFLYFSYSGLYCMGDLRLPSYTQSDTCQGVAHAASKLDTMVQAAVSRFGPNIKFDIIAHSMGGMVAAYWLATTTSEMRARVHSVVTFDSPLRGVPANKSSIAFVTACGVSDPSVKDLSCIEIPRPCESEIVWAIAHIGTLVPFYTINATLEEPGLGDELVPGERTTLLRSESKLHCSFPDTHSGIWASAKIFRAFAASCRSRELSPETEFTIWQPNGNEKQIFVGCAVAGLSAQECKEKLLEAFSG